MMSTSVKSGPQAVAAATANAEDENVSCSTMLEGIHGCLRRWKAARHEGQAVLTELSNTLLLRTFIDKGRGASGAGAVWGALANAGATVSQISVASEARARRLHGDLSALQDAMLAAASELRRHALAARRRWCHYCAAEDAAARLSTARDGALAGAEISRAAAATDDVAAIGGGYGLGDVADAASQVAEMLLKEALVTATVAQGVGECRDGREVLTVYAAAWMMQPYLDEQGLKGLETMVSGQKKRT